MSDIQIKPKTLTVKPLNLEPGQPSKEKQMEAALRSMLLGSLKQAISKMTQAVSQWNAKLREVIEGKSV